MTKKEARAAAGTAFESWAGTDPDIQEAASAAIWERIEASREFREASSVLVYMSIRGEVLTRAFIERWRLSKRIAIPLVKGDSLILKQYDPERLTQGYRGITEPSDDAEDAAPEDIGLALVPGAAFSLKDGRVMRLGRGGGFYDRLLPELRCPRFGVSYACRTFEDIPTDPWDVPLDRLITEKT